MATKLDLLKSFATGQGVSGGLPFYSNYPGDHDTNYAAIESTVNTLVDEVAAARLTDALLPVDLLVSDDLETNNSSNGRFSPWECRVTRSGATLTITSGRIYANGQRVDVTGTTFSAVRANGLYYIATDQSGLLSISTTASNSFFDITSVTVASNLWTSPNTDFLAPDTQRVPLISANTSNVIYHRTDFTGGNVGNGSPAIRLAGADGTLEDAGLSHTGTASEFRWLSQKDGGEGTGSNVVAGEFTQKGQLSLLEQARVFAVRSTDQGIATGAGFTAITFTAPVANGAGNAVRREPEAYFTNPFYSASTATLTIPTDAGLDGTYLFTAWVQFKSATAAGYVDAQIIQTVGGSAVIARQRVAPSGTGDTFITLSGMYDFVNTDAWQLQVDHGDAGTIQVQARFTAMLVGGGV